MPFRIGLCLVFAVITVPGQVQACQDGEVAKAFTSALINQSKSPWETKPGKQVRRSKIQQRSHSNEDAFEWAESTDAKHETESNLAKVKPTTKRTTPAGWISNPYLQQANVGQPKLPIQNKFSQNPVEVRPATHSEVPQKASVAPSARDSWMDDSMPGATEFEVPSIAPADEGKYEVIELHQRFDEGVAPQAEENQDFLSGTPANAELRLNESNADTTMMLPQGDFIVPNKTAQQTTIAKQPATAMPPALRSAPQARVSANKQPLFVPESVLLKAVHHIEYGKSLARRGSAFTARQEFLSAVGLVSQSFDSQVGNGERSQSLKMAITALREAEDFYLQDSESQLTLNVAHTMEAHQTKAIDARQAVGMSHIEAMQRYFLFAQNHLQFAAGENVVSAEALYSMGRLHSLLSGHKTSSDPLNTAKAIVYHHAALGCNPRHYKSAMELGQLMAQSGQLQKAKQLFQTSLMAHQTPEGWQRLAMVHRQLNEPELANIAAKKQVLRRDEAPQTAGVTWMGPEQFNSMAPWDAHESVASMPTISAAPKAEQKAQQNEKQTLFGRIKKIF